MNTTKANFQDKIPKDHVCDMCGKGVLDGAVFKVTPRLGKYTGLVYYPTYLCNPCRYDRYEGRRSQLPLKEMAKKVKRKAKVKLTVREQIAKYFDMERG
mgnify:CR=1 FL=1